jgi:hypothetical protein
MRPLALVKKTGCMCLWKKEWEYGKILLLKVLEIRIKYFCFARESSAFYRRIATFEEVNQCLLERNSQ